MNKLFLIFLLFLVSVSLSSLSVSLTYAWTGYTHEWICNKANLSNLDCALADNPKMQSEHPNIIFKNHHCTSNTHDCSARKIADNYMTMTSTTPHARDFAAHLYSDSMVPVHWYSFDYDTCHKIFEDKVEEKLREQGKVRYNLFGSSIDFTEWNITMQCSAKIGKTNYTDVTLYVDNKYMDIVSQYVADQMHSNYVKDEVKVYDLTKVVYVLIVILIIVFILFVYFGMKNRKNNGRKIRR